jgi:2-oxoisovalerate dehydrogenase E1 component beta subunit
MCTRNQVTGVAEKTYIEAIRDGIREEMQRDERVMILGEDVGAKGGVFGVTEGLQKEFGEARVLDSPLAESLIVGVAIGAAMNGLRPIAEIQFQDFIMPAVDQIISEAAKMRYRSNGDWGVPMVLRSPFGGGVHGALYHSQSIEAIFAHIPGLRVVVPSNPYDAKGMIISALRDPDPVLYFEHKRCYRAIKGEVPDGEYTVPLDRARVVREGNDIAVFSYGMMVHSSLEAVDRLAADGFSCEVVDLRSLRPFDRDAIVASASKCGKVLIVQEANLAVSVASEVAAIIAEACFDSLDAPVMRLGGPEIPAMPFAPPLEQFYLVTPDKVEAKLRELAAY